MNRITLAAALMLWTGAACAGDKPLGVLPPVVRLQVDAPTADFMIGIDLVSKTKDDTKLMMPMLTVTPNRNLAPGAPDLSIEIGHPKTPMPASGTLIYIGGKGGCLIEYNEICVINGSKLEVWK